MDYDGLILVDYGSCGLILVVVVWRRGVVKLILGNCYGGQQWLDEFRVWLQWSMMVDLGFAIVVGCGCSWCSDLVGVGCGQWLWLVLHLFIFIVVVFQVILMCCIYYFNILYGKIEYQVNCKIV